MKESSGIERSPGDLHITIGANIAGAFAYFDADHPGRSIAETVLVATIKRELEAQGFEFVDPAPPRGMG